MQVPPRCSCAAAPHEGVVYRYFTAHHPSARFRRMRRHCSDSWKSIPEIRFRLVGFSFSGRHGRAIATGEKACFVGRRICARIAETGNKSRTLELGNPFCRRQNEHQVFDAGLVGVATRGSGENFRAAIADGNQTVSWLATPPSGVARSSADRLGERARKLGEGGTGSGEETLQIARKPPRHQALRLQQPPQPRWRHLLSPSGRGSNPTKLGEGARSQRAPCRTRRDRA